jgi:hypothetical protein
VYIFLLLHQRQVSTPVSARISPITAFSEKVRTLTSTDSAPSLMSSAPAIMMIIQIIFDYLLENENTPEGFDAYLY